MKLKPLDRQVVVVFGASSGIGRLTARKMAAAGARLVVAARSSGLLASLVREIRGKGGEIVACTADTSDFDQVQQVARTAFETFGSLDCWVHLAAVSSWARFEDTAPEDWKRIVDVNLNGQAYGAMAALPYLRKSIDENGGVSLIHISSGEAEVALPLQSAYVASKHGVHGFLKSLRIELGAEGVPISVTEILPAGINTGFFNKAQTRLGVKPRPLPPVYPPKVVADAVVYAARHPVPEIIAGGAAWAGIVMQKLSQPLLNALLKKAGIPLQKSGEPKPENAPNNLYEAIEDGRIEGDFSAETLPGSLYTWMKTHPQVVGPLVAAAAVAWFIKPRKSPPHPLAA